MQRHYHLLTFDILNMKTSTTEIDHIRDIIINAFKDVKLGNGIGLREAQGIDDYATAEVCASYRANDEKDSWQNIAVKELNQCYSSLSFFDAEGMRFHLPAYLIADLNGEYQQDITYTLAYLNEYRIKQFSLLSPAQRNAVRTFVLYLSVNDNYIYDRPHILRSLEEYWTEQSIS